MGILSLEMTIPLQFLLREVLALLPGQVEEAMPGTGMEHVATRLPED